MTDLRRLRVLGVDDNATNRALLVAQFTAWEMHVDCVANASRALESLRTAYRDARPYDLAILDHQMPDMDGMTLARAIKSDPVLAPLPLVLLTSVSYRGSAGEAQRAGFSAFLLKPIRQSQLYDCIVSVMGTAATEPSPARLITRHTLEGSAGPVARASSRRRGQRGESKSRAAYAGEARVPGGRRGEWT